MPDFSRLNEGERTALDLLARGHTAKSIATLTGRSVGAVNERLREARRKTGIGSSRELARLLQEQENRDEQIGVAMPGPAAATAEPEAVRPAGGTIPKGPIVMIALLLTAAAAAALTFTTPTAPSPAAQDASIDAFFPDNAHDARRLVALVRSETRDPAWAPIAEAALLAQLGAVAGEGAPLSVTCAATVCAVTGSLPASLSDPQKSAAVQALQDVGSGDTLGKAGLKSREWFGIRGAPGEPERFAMLWIRKP